MPTVEEGQPKPSTRHRSRRNVIGSSVHREDYVGLMRAGWSSEAISRYAGYRFGEDIPASTIRHYRNRNKVRAATAPAFPGLQQGQPGTDPEKRLDVMGLRAEAIQLQLARIRVEVAAEQGAARLLPTVRDELRLLNTLLNDHKADQQDWGLAPKAGDRVDPLPAALPGVPSPAAAGAPKFQTIGEMFGVPDGSDAEREIAVRLHLATRDGKAVAG